VLKKLKSDKVNHKRMTLKASQSHANLGMKLKKIIKQISTLGIHAYPSKNKQLDTGKRHHIDLEDEAL
jgi:hypothetical protein